jgi:membrane protease YdiL (CAAX protease family)
MATLAFPNQFQPRGAVAPVWHTAVFVSFFLLLAAAGALAQQEAAKGGGLTSGNRPDLAPTYAFMIAAELGLVAFVWKLGLRRTGTSLSDLIGGRWTSAKAVVTDILVAGAAWILLKGVAGLLFVLFDAGRTSSVSPLLPSNLLERVLWVALSISAGFAEEVVFRGYLQRQLFAYSGSFPLAVLLQASVFAVAHGYQGARNCLMIAVFGMPFTLLSEWRKSLRPGILAHAWTDLASGLLR